MKIGLQYIFCVFCFSVFISCTEKQDFSQFDDLSLTPTYEASIIYIEATENAINLAGVTNFISKTFSFNAFTEGIFSDRVLDGVITYEVENTTSKQLDIVIEFLDENQSVLDTENFVIDALSTTALHREVSYGNGGRNIDIIKNTSGLRLGGNNLGDTSSIADIANPLVIIKSSAKFRVRIK